MAKFYAVGYTNGGANEKRLGPFDNISDAWKSGQVEQGSTRRFSFAGVVDENGQYVSYNSRACNSSNPVVRKAMNATRAKNAAFDDGSVLVSYRGFGSPTETQKRMTSRDFKTWLEKNSLGDKAQDIWFALMKGDDYSFVAGATKVKVKAL